MPPRIKPPPEQAEPEEEAEPVTKDVAALAELRKSIEDGVRVPEAAGLNPTEPVAEQKGKHYLEGAQWIAAQLMSARDLIQQKNALLADRQQTIVYLQKRVAELEPIVLQQENTASQDANKITAAEAGLPVGFGIKRDEKGWYLAEPGSPG